MSAVILLAKLGLFALSAAGWCLVLNRRLGLQAEFAPIVAFSAIGAAMAGAGLLNIFTPVEWALYLGGLGCAAAVGLKDKAEALKSWLNVRTAIFLAGCLWLLFLTRGGVIWGHDNMSHWAIAAKTIFTQNQLPNTANTAVEFTGYPPAAACFIKYLCRFVGFSDGLMMFAQGLLILSALFALSAFVGPRHKLGGGAALLAFSALFLTCNVPLNDLRVDTLLTAQGLAALAIIGWYGGQSPKKALLFSLAPLVFLSQVKNSGLFLIAMDLAVLLYFALKAKTPAKSLAKGAALALGGPLGSYYLWTRHVAMVFPAGESSKHAVSLGSYANIFGSKTAEEVAQFNGLFAEHLTSFDNPDVWTLAYLLLLLAICTVNLWCDKQKYGKKTALLLLGGVLGAELLYIGSLWCTYTLSMNTSEMLVLASIERYHTTVLMYLLGGLLLVEMTIMQDEPKNSRMGWGMMVLFVLLLPHVGIEEDAKTTLYSREPYRKTETQGELLELKAEYGLTDGSRYLFYTRGGDTSTWHMRYVARYVFNTNDVEFWQYEDEEFTWNQLYNEYDYFILYDPDERSDAFLEEGGFAPGTECVHLILP